jgi:hypothetical protein
MIFNTWYALIAGVIFMAVFFYSTSKIVGGVARGWKVIPQLFAMVIGTSGLVLFLIWPIRSEPFMLDNSYSFAAGTAFGGDSIFVHLGSFDDNVVVNMKSRSKLEYWPTDLAQAANAQGILHSKLISAVGICIQAESRFVDAQEYDELFRVKQVRIREKSIDKSISIR